MQPSGRARAATLHIRWPAGAAPRQGGVMRAGRARPHLGRRCRRQVAPLLPHAPVGLRGSWPASTPPSCPPTAGCRGKCKEKCTSVKKNVKMKTQGCKNGLQNNGLQKLGCKSENVSQVISWAGQGKAGGRHWGASTPAAVGLQLHRPSASLCWRACMGHACRLTGPGWLDARHEPPT